VHQVFSPQSAILEIAMSTLASWFYLRPDKRSFKPDPLQDKDAMFCNQEVQASIELSVERAFATDETIKLLLWGDWGVGKTHTLRHLAYWLDTNGTRFPTKTIFVAFGDVAKSSRFAIVHKDLLDGLGIEVAIQIVHLYMQNVGNLLAGLDGIGIPAPVAQAFNKLLVATPGQAAPEIVVTAWNYLRGANVGKAGTALGLQEQMVDSKDFYFALAALGHIYKKVHHKQLLFLVDEASRLEAVEDLLEVERHWVHANTLIFDQENRYFGFVYTVSGRSDKSLPRALFETQIENRLGNRKLELKNLLVDGVRQFIRNLCDRFVDQRALEADAQAAVAADKDYSWSNYPFTAGALDRFVEHFQRAPENSKPRDIAERIDEAGFYAMKDGKRLIDEETLSKIGL
jgi:hypothetical protein